MIDNSKLIGMFLNIYMHTEVTFRKDIGQKYPTFISSHYVLQFPCGLWKCEISSGNLGLETQAVISQGVSSLRGQRKGAISCIRL